MQSISEFRTPGSSDEIDQMPEGLLGIRSVDRGRVPIRKWLADNDTQDTLRVARVTTRCLSNKLSADFMRRL